MKLKVTASIVTANNESFGTIVTMKNNNRSFLILKYLFENSDPLHTVPEDIIIQFQVCKIVIWNRTMTKINEK